MHYRQVEDYDYPDEEEFLDRDIYGDPTRQPSWIKNNNRIQSCSCIRRTTYGQHWIQRTGTIDLQGLHREPLIECQVSVRY